MLKRSFDIVSSVVVCMTLAPLMGAIALWVHLDSKGPVFFKQERIGQGGVPFRILKFRTMHHRAPDDIDQINERVVSDDTDARITRAGRLLRRTSLDELPQLMNIISGDMSVVGPRPVIPEQLEVVPEVYLERFDVRPGLTGLAQIRGRRTLGWLEQLEADAEYVRTRSFLRDLWIILKTVEVVVMSKGIYGGTGQNWRAYRAQIKGEETPE